MAFANGIHIIALEPIFIPFDAPTFNLEPYREHYNKNLGLNLTDTQIKENVYGGRPLTDLYSAVEIRVDDGGLKKLRGTIKLIAANGGLVRENLVIRKVSLRQFLIAGFPHFNESHGNFPVSGTWNGNDNWSSLDSQYLLELCHSEISRWSLFFIKESNKDPERGVAVGDFKKSQLSGAGKDFSRIELVNNCTTAEGFEFRVRFKGDLFHGSFGARGYLNPIYHDLSRQQAGTWADQDRDLTQSSSSTFFNNYSRSLGWNGLSTDSTDVNQDSNAPENMPQIDLCRYLQGASKILGSSFSGQVEIEEGKICYQRWGVGTEYENKAKKRRLVLEVKRSKDQTSFGCRKHTTKFTMPRKLSFQISVKMASTASIFRNPSVAINVWRNYSASRTDLGLKLVIRDVLGDEHSRFLSRNCC